MRTIVAVVVLIVSCVAALLFALVSGVDSVTAASGVSVLVQLELREPDGDVIIVRVTGPNNFYYKLYSNQLNVHRPHDTRIKATLFAKTNEFGWWKVYVDKAALPELVTITPDLRRSTGNHKADLISLNISGQLARVFVRGSANSVELRGPQFGTVQFTDHLGSLSADSNINQLAVGHLNGALITTTHGSIKSMTVASNMIDTTVWTGIDRFYGPPGVGGRDLGTLTVHGRMDGCFVYMGPATFGADFEQPTGRLGTLRLLRLGAQTGIVENTVIVSSNGVHKIKGVIGPNVVINGVVTNAAVFQ